LIGIDGIGVFTPVGLNVPQTMGSLRTGLERYSELEGILGADGEPVVAAATPVIGDGLLEEEREIVIGASALRECAGDRNREPLPVLFCAPEPADQVTSFERVLAGMARESSVAIDHDQSAIFASGHAAIGPALARARELITAGRAQACYVGAVDSLLHRKRLARLISAERIKDGNNSDGLVPGEAATFLRVGRASSQSLASVRGIGIAFESATRESGKPANGVGLANAMRGALADARATARDISLLATDLSGERRSFQDLALALTRLRMERATPLPQYSLAESIGEVGAAVGPLSLAYCAFTLRAGGAPGPGVMFVGGSDSGARTAVMLWEVHRGIG